MAYFLCLETSGDICSVCISKDLVMLSEVSSTKDFSHTKHITIYIQQCLQKASLKINDIHCVVISGGPGSYTGLRVAASTAKALCYSLNIPLIAIDSLTALASSVESINKELLIVPVIDARNNNAYSCVFDFGIQKLKDIDFIKLSDDFLSDYEANFVFIGSGVNVLKQNGWYTQHDLIMKDETAINLIKPAFIKYLDKDFEDYKLFSPFYLNNPNITTSRKQLI